MLCFEPLELVEESIELLVRDLGVVVDVVALLVLPDRITQFAQAFFGSHQTRAGTTKTRRTRSHTKKAGFLRDVRGASCFRGCIFDYPEIGQSGGPSSGAPSSSPATSANVRY